MSQHPFLKSIQPVNLLSFGPKTEPIELRPLNILIGPNGSGKSNLIEILRLLGMLPEKEPWSNVLQTGGADEWLWQGGQSQKSRAFVTAKIQWDMPHSERFTNEPLVYEYKIGLDKFQEGDGSLSLRLHGGNNPRLCACRARKRSGLCSFVAGRLGYCCYH